MSKHNPTTEQMEVVTGGNGEEISNGWHNAASLQEKVKQERRLLRSSLTVKVKHNTPLEQVCMSASLYDVVSKALSLSATHKIRGRLVKCDDVEITAKGIVEGILAMYEKAKEAQADGRLQAADICTLTEKGIKTDRYAFEFVEAQ